MSMQTVLKCFMSIGVVSLSLSPVAGFSRDAGGDKKNVISAEQIGAYVYRDEIKAGRLTAKQAGEYYRCSEDDYGVRLRENTPLVLRLNERVERLGMNQKMSADEKVALDADNREVDKLRSQSQDMCVNKLGLKVKPKSSN
ncbi:MAG: hypothetical protein FWD51_01045 [Betaproteobacteria bacterium]|nr:hypothetical protein [Betaproteobacteria bacterium]